MNLFPLKQNLFRQDKLQIKKSGQEQKLNFIHQKIFGLLITQISIKNLLQLFMNQSSVNLMFQIQNLLLTLLTH
jgi:hypothetical protein